MILGMDTHPTYFEVTNMSEEDARAYLESIRWPNGPTCPHCGSTRKPYTLKGKAHRAGLYKCSEKGCRRQFTVTVGTIFHRSHIPLKKWVLAFHMVCASKKAISALQLQRMLDLKSYKSAWHMAHRIRHAMAHGIDNEPMTGPVEMDETYVGPNPRNLSREKRRKNKDWRVKRKTGRGTDKVAVMVLVERDGRAHAEAVRKVTANEAVRMLRQNTDGDPILYTDEFAVYRGVSMRYGGDHRVICHKKAYAIEDTHTNNAESFNALIKRCIMGAWHHVSWEHINRYLAEIAFRWSTRRMTDSERTRLALQQGDGVRLVYGPANA